MTIMETSPQEKNSSAASFFSPMRDLRGAKLHWQSALRTVIIEQESLWNVMEDMSWAKQRKWSPEPACPAQQKNRWGVEKMSCGEGTGVPGRPGRRLPGRLWKPPLHWALLGVLWFSCPRHWALGQSLGLWLGGLCGWTTPLSRPLSWDQETADKLAKWLCPVSFSLSLTAAHLLSLWDVLTIPNGAVIQLRLILSPRAWDADCWQINQPVLYHLAFNGLQRNEVRKSSVSWWIL